MLQYPYPIRLTPIWGKTMQQFSERLSSCRTQQEYTQVGIRIFRFFRTEGSNHFPDRRRIPRQHQDPHDCVVWVLCHMGRESRNYSQLFIAARSCSFASSTFRRDRMKVMIASRAKGITRYMIFSIEMQESG